MGRPRPIGIGPKRTMDDAVDAAVASEDRTPFLVGVTRLAEVLGRDRGTISSWIDKGCPTAKRGGPGEMTSLDPRDVFAWREQHVRDEEAGKYAAPAGSGLPGAPMKPADLVKLEDLKLKRLQVGQKAEVLVPRVVVEAAFERCLGLVRQAVMAVPERLVREMSGYPEDKKLVWRQKALTQCRAALTEGAKAMSEAMTGFEPPKP